MDSRQKVLVVDDKPENLKSLEVVLKKLDVELIKATNGNDALKLLLNHKIALAILDIQMPGMDGYELAELIRSEKANKNLPIIFVSAVYSDEMHIFKSYEVGAIDFIAKPFNVDILLNKVKIFITLDRQKSMLMDLNKNLEAKVEERTAELRKALKAEEHANRAKSEFLSNISHELRTPMHQILSYAKFGIDKMDIVDKAKLVYYFDKIDKSGKNLLVLLNNLLDLSKMESGKMDYLIKKTNLRRIVIDVRSEFAALAENKQIKIKMIENGQDFNVECDEHKISQVVRNLLSNALKFTPKRSKINISLEHSEIKTCEHYLLSEIKRGLVVKVSDQGIGIPENELDKVFDQFIQSTKTKNGSGGTGLGLSICKRIIEAHNGKIWAQNNDDKGVTFSFIIPYFTNEPV